MIVSTDTAVEFCMPSIDENRPRWSSLVESTKTTSEEHRRWPNEPGSINSLYWGGHPTNRESL